jgi:hypothetical protein
MRFRSHIRNDKPGLPAKRSEFFRNRRFQLFFQHPHFLNVHRYFLPLWFSESGGRTTPCRDTGGNSRGSSFMCAFLPPDPDGWVIL